MRTAEENSCGHSARPDTLEGREAFSCEPAMGWKGVSIPLLGLLLLAAHSLRLGDIWLVASLLVLGALCCTRQGWGRLVVALVLLCGSLLWVRTGIDFVQIRLALGQSWMRLAAIMAGVSLFSLAGSVLLLREPARRRFHKRHETAVPQAVACVISIALLWICRNSTPKIALLLADRYVPGSGVLEMTLVGCYAAVLCGWLLDRRTMRTARARAWLLFSVVFFGQLVLGLAGVPHMLMTGDLHLPVPALIIAGPLFRGDGVFMLILFAVSALLVGPAWCSHLCYIGAWDDRLSRMHHGRPAALPARAWVWRAAIAGVVFGCALLLRALGASVLLATSGAALFGLAGVALMVVGSSRTGTMVHCTSFCPMGLVGNLLGKVSPWRLRINDNCTRCGACTRVCRYNALREHDIAAGRPGLTCSLCRDCTSVCAHGAMELQFPLLSSSTSERLFVTVVVSLHAMFLAVARM